MAKWLRRSVGGLLALAVLAGCSRAPVETDPLSGRILVFCAGALALPMSKVKARYEALHPDRQVDIEPSGSRFALRKWIQLGRQADVVALADRHLITDEAMPKHASWCVMFAGNSMVIAFTDQAKHSVDMSTDTWMDVLSRPGVTVGRSDPDMDPCGYRALMVLKLADLYYPPERGGGSIEKRVLANSPPRCVRPKSVELASMLQSKQLDYAFMYRSSAVQHHIPFVALPPEIDLSDPKRDDSYARVSIQVSGKTPSERVAYVARSIAFGVTVPREAPHRLAGEEFVAFMLGPEGRAAFDELGQPFLPKFGAFGRVPDRVRAAYTP